MPTYRLKSTKVMPPKGWSFFQPETGWRIPNPLNISYTEAIRLIINHRTANPAKKLATDPESVGAQLQNYIAHQIGFDPNHCEPADPEDKKKLSHPAFLQLLSKGVARAVDELRKTANGARILSEWFGEGAEPVPQGIAQARANICLKCPENKQRRGRLAFTVANAILEHEKAKSHLELKVENEKALKTCGVCSCYLPLKVWVPEKHFKQPDDAEKFPSNCWINNPPVQNRKIRIRRKAAFGDVIEATVLATKLKTQNVDIIWETDEPIIPILQNHPDISEVVSISDQKPDINLDATYELDPERGTKHIAELFVKAANPQIQTARLAAVDSLNWFPKIRVDEQKKAEVLAFMSKFQKPWIVINPRSNSWTNREVPFDIWAEAKKHVQGTFFWVGTEKAGSPIVNLGCFEFAKVVAAISCADVVATVDTGPMHVAAALKVPMVVIQQSFRIDLRLSDQMDYITASADIGCLGCDQYRCPKLEEQKVPCCHPKPEAVAAAINRKLYKPGSVSAIIPVLNPEIGRLTKCLNHLVDQVDEIVISVDGPRLNNLQTMIPMNKVKIIHRPSEERTGFGRTCNRGIRETSGEFVLVMNDDCFMGTHSVSYLKAPMKDPKVAVVGGLLRYPDGRIQHGGTVPVGALRWGHVDHGKTEASITEITEMDYVTFCGALVRRKAFYDAQGFDQIYDTYNEDSDICLTMRKLGWKILYQPKAESIHQESQTSSPLKGQLALDSQRKMESKWKGKL